MDARVSRRILLLFAGAVAVVACGTVSIGAESPGGQCPAVPGRAAAEIKFTADIQPVFDDNCVACHQEGSANQGLVLESGQSLGRLVRKRSTEAKLNLVEPGNPGKSYLFAKISGTQKEAGGNGARMPQGGTLDPRATALICNWIANGAPNN